MEASDSFASSPITCATSVARRRRAVFVEQEGWSNGTLAHELLKAAFVDPIYDLGIDVGRDRA
jgi:hypothetical protein